MNDHSSMLTTQEVAGFLRISIRTVNRRIRQGKIDPVRIGRRYLVSRPQVEGLMQSPESMA